MVVAVDYLITADRVEWEFQLANLFDFNWIRIILGRPLPYGHGSVRSFFCNDWFFGLGCTASAVKHAEIPAANPFAMTGVVEDVPGNRVNAAGQFRRVDIEEAHRAAAVRVSREHRCDIGAE